MEEQDGTLPSPRVGDEERQRALVLLRDSCRDGLLTLDEFSERATRALNAQSRSDLDTVLADLPVPAAAPVRVQRGTRWLIAVFGTNRQRVRWRLRRRAHAAAIFGSCALDLRCATIDGDEVLITAVGLFGSVTVVAPEGIGVESTGIAIFGSKSDRSTDDEVLPDAPVIRLRALALFGSVKVRNISEPGGVSAELREEIVRSKLGLPLRPIDPPNRS